MAIAISTVLADLLCEAAATALDSGVIRIYTGAAPATADDDNSGTLLAEFTMASPAFGVPGSAVMLANAINASTWIASGTAGHFRAYAAGSPEETLVQGSVATSGADMTISSINAVAGGVVSITGWTWTQNKS